MKNLVLLSLFSVLLTGCLKTREQLRNDISGQQEQVAVQKQVVALQQQQAQETVQSEELSEQLRVMTGRIETLENELRLENQRRLETSKNKVQNDSANAEKFKLFEEAITRLEKKVDAMQAELTAVKAAKAKAVKATPKKKVGNFVGAERAFDKKKWKQAIAGYQKYRELNPSGRRYPDATYKIGVSFEELGMKTEATAFYKEVIEKFPKSKIVKRAKYRLNKL